MGFQVFASPEAAGITARPRYSMAESTDDVIEPGGGSNSSLRSVLGGSSCVMESFGVGQANGSFDPSRTDVSFDDSVK